MTHDAGATHLDPAYRSALVTCAGLNAAMFFVEGGIGLAIGSAALIADAADFLEDACIYGLAIAAIGWSARNRAIAGAIMGGAMLTVGLVALWQVAERLMQGGVPSSPAMAATAALALTANGYSSYRLVRFRCGDASVRSIWLSTRNDALLNALTIVGAGLIAIVGRAWPDIVAGAIIAAVNLWSAFEILSKARQELTDAEP